MALKAVYSQGRTQGARGGVGSGVVEVRLAFHPTALPAPSFVSLVHPWPTAPGKGRTPGAGGRAGSDVVEVGSALNPAALPVPSFVSLVHP